MQVAIVLFDVLEFDEVLAVVFLGSVLLCFIEYCHRGIVYGAHVTGGA